MAEKLSLSMSERGARWILESMDELIAKFDRITAEASRTGDEDLLADTGNDRGDLSCYRDWFEEEAVKIFGEKIKRRSPEDYSTV